MTNTERLIRLKVISEEMSKIHKDLCSNTNSRDSWESARSDEALDIVLGISQLMYQFEQAQQAETETAAIMDKLNSENVRYDHPVVDTNADLQRRLYNAKNGDIIIMDGKKYKVLKTDKRFVELLSMFDIDTCAWGKTTYYPDSKINQRLDEFVNSLPDKIKNAIEQTTIPCCAFDEAGYDISSDDGELDDTLQIELNPTRFDFEAPKYQYVEVNESRGMAQVKAFLPSIQDIKSFCGRRITSDDIHKLFWCGYEGTPRNIALRDICFLENQFVWRVNAKDSFLESYWCGDTLGIRAVFIMDINKLF